MDELSQDPAIAAVGSAVIASGVQGLAAAAAGVATVTGLAPAGADEVSAQAAAAFAAEGVRMLGLIEAALQEITRAGAAFVQIAATYAGADEAEGERLRQVGDTIGSAN